MQIIDWNLISCGLNENINKGIILYGASGSGEKIVMLLETLGLSDKIITVTDSDEKKWGTIWMGYEVSNPYKLNTITNEALIIITSVYLDEISNFLKNKLKCLHKVCSRFAFQQAIHYSIMNNTSHLINNKNIQKYKMKYELWKNNTILIRDNERALVIAETIKHIQENKKNILLCGIPKTGNTTLTESFAANARLNNINFMMHSSYYDEYSYKIMKETLYNYTFCDIKIISGVRQPIERIISQQWQKIDIMYQHNEVCISNLVDKNYDKFTDNIIFSQKKEGTNFHNRDWYYADIYDWFKDQIEKMFGIDVFAYKFDKEKGYSIIQKNNIKLFIYRLDKLSSLEREIGEFIGDSSFILKNSNIANKKRYMFAYRQYLEQVKVKKEFFNTLINSQGMTHFYTEEECRQYISKWKAKLV